MVRPSGDQYGSMSAESPPVSEIRSFSPTVPSVRTGVIQMCMAEDPKREPEKTTHLPSGEKRPPNCFRTGLPAHGIRGRFGFRLDQIHNCSLESRDSKRTSSPRKPTCVGRLQDSQILSVWPLEMGRI